MTRPSTIPPLDSQSRYSLQRGVLDHCFSRHCFSRHRDLRHGELRYWVKALCCLVFIFGSTQTIETVWAQATTDQPVTSGLASEESQSHDALLDEQPAPLEDPPIDPSWRTHWSFRDLVAPTIPKVHDRTTVEQPLDSFIQHEHHSRGISPLPPATARVWLRRLSFNMRGLPPTPRDLERFEQDTRPDRWARQVDRWLASHAYGEHLATFWLDLARFAETDGFEHDLIRSDAWRYRDWVVQALNADMPYDQFVTWQLAGDEVAPQDPDALIATGFCLAGPDMPDINSQDERRHHLLNGMTSTIGQVFLGLQLGCAQCHDHKFDPISQGDFYRLRAVFEPAVVLKKNQSVKTLSQQPTEVQTHLMLRGDWQRPGPVVSPAYLRIANFDQRSLLAEADRWSGAGEGIRATFASWLTEAKHPLTSRVIANRLWQFHFGRALVRTPSDFGQMGGSPSQPQLLDHLATELIRCDWSMKRLQRQLLLSSVYRRASDSEHNLTHEDGLPEVDTELASRTAAEVKAVPTAWEILMQQDPGNRWWSRFPRQRLSAEEVRDALLTVSGQLNRQAGGPGIRPPLPEELKSELLKGQWNVTDDSSQYRRRSLYVFVRRNFRLPILESFDRPDANESCPQRFQSTTALQSLQLLNSPVSWEAACELARRLELETDSLPKRLDRLFLLTFGRLPSDNERRVSTDFIASYESTPAAWQDLCLAMINANEFLYID